MLLGRGRKEGGGGAIITIWVVVAYITGIPVPMILRQVVGSEAFMVIGPAYVLGLMNGEKFNAEDMRMISLV